mmetsp:Transcript_9950/g.24825  ORF Transcript_9950/g.24825 Transcript_9950/m.24825 type:complete len:562 (+) Transcript_9950:90-1775(+)
MASFGDSFLDMAEAMLGKHNAAPSFEVSTVPEESAKDSTPALKRIRSDEDTDISSSSSSSHSDTQSDRHINTSDKMEQRNIVAVTPPKRRRRMMGNYSTMDAVLGLNHAMSKSERLDALENAIATFDHDDRHRHDTEIEAGADIALVKNLVLLEFKGGFRRDPTKGDMETITEEISTVLKCLECVYRASSDAVGKSFNRVGDDLIQILVALIDDETRSRQNNHRSKNPTTKDDHSSEGNKDGVNGGNNEGNRTRDQMMRTATKIIGHFARVGKATRPMARFPGFLGSILNVCKIRPYSMIPFEARLSCLWTIANLACNADNMTMMMGTPNLMDSLVTIGTRRLDSGATVEYIMETLRAKSIVSRTLLNLSWSLENKEHMSKNPILVQTLCQLAMERQAPYKNSKTMQKILVQSRRHSLASLRNISAAPKEAKISLCNYNHGKLLDTLTDVILNESDQSAVNFAFYAVNNLAIHETAEAIVDRAALVLAMKNVLLEESDSSGEGEKYTIKCQCASATILILEKAITPDKPSYENLRELLDTINPCNSDVCADESSSLKATAV